VTVCSPTCVASGAVECVSLSFFVSYLQAMRVGDGNGEGWGWEDTIGEEEKRVQGEEAHRIG
jgi:hypothetical protein